MIITLYESSLIYLFKTISTQILSNEEDDKPSLLEAPMATLHVGDSKQI